MLTTSSSGSVFPGFCFSLNEVLTYSQSSPIPTFPGSFAW